MHEYMSDRTRRHAYGFSILLAALLVRVLIGLAKPVMNMEQSALIGLTAVVFLSPFLHRTFYGEELLDTTRKKASHLLAMGLSAGLFVYYIALA